MSEKRVKLNQIVKNQLPSYVQEDFPLVGEFLSQYYQGQEYQGGPVDLIQNIDSYVKLSECGNLIQSTNTTAYAESSELNKYGARFKYSRFLKVIDSSHESVTSNITTVEMRRDLRLAISEVAEYAIDFGNEFHIQSMNGFNIRSSAFRVLNINTDVYLYDVPDPTAEKGQISLFSLDEGSSTPVIQRRNIGVIDYKKGRITLDPINIVSGKTKDNVDILEISATPESNDIIGLQDLYLQLDSSFVDMVVDEISSGSDPSGSTYTVTTSYKNGNIIR